MAQLGVRVSLAPEADAQALALTLQQIVNQQTHPEQQSLQLQPSEHQTSEWTVSGLSDSQHQLALACQLQWATTENRPCVQVRAASWPTVDGVVLLMT